MITSITQHHVRCITSRTSVERYHAFASGDPVRRGSALAKAVVFSIFGGNVKNVIRTLAVLLGLLLVIAVVAYATETTPGTVILKGAPMGGVKFDHKAHEGRGIKCDTCHHASKAEKALKSDHESCQNCHTTTAAAPMKTKAQAAFHNPTATAGVCAECHKAENVKGKKAPTKCMECHQKANA
jgi:Class III cytochrome C family